MGFSSGLGALKYAAPFVGQAMLAKDALDEFGSGGGSVTQGPLRTKEQRDAQRLLLGFAETGKFGDFKAGADLGLGIGDYRMTDLEGEGLSGLQALLRSGIPDNYRLSDAALRDLMDTSEAGLDKQFAPFKALTERAMRDADTAVRRGAGFAGNLYSTDTIRKLGDVTARGQESMMAELARLSNSALDRKLSAVPLAMQSARDQEGLALGRVDASQTYGSLARRLNDANIKARDAEILRRREELKLPIQTATALGGMNANFGVESVPKPSPYQELLGLAAQVGGQYLGNYAGARGYAAGMRG